MALTDAFQAMMEEYTGAVGEVQKNRRFFDGLLGMGNHPANAACHDLMDRKAAEICREAAESGSASEKAELIRAIFRAEQEWDGPEYARLMLAAIQRHTLEILPGLDPGDRQELAAWYRQTYPRHRRLPVQDQVLKALEGK